MAAAGLEEGMVGEEREPREGGRAGGGYRKPRERARLPVLHSPSRCTPGARESGRGTSPSPERPEIEAAIPRPIRALPSPPSTAPTPPASVLVPIWHAPGPPQRVLARSTSACPHPRASEALSPRARLPASEAPGTRPSNPSCAPIRRSRRAERTGFDQHASRAATCPRTYMSAFGSCASFSGTPAHAPPASTPCMIDPCCRHRRLAASHRPGMCCSTVLAACTVHTGLQRTRLSAGLNGINITACPT